MWRLLRILFYIAVLGAAGVVGYAYLGDLSPRIGEVRQTVVLDAD